MAARLFRLRRRSPELYYIGLANMLSELRKYALALRSRINISAAVTGDQARGTWYTVPSFSYRVARRMGRTCKEFQEDSMRWI